MTERWMAVAGFAGYEVSSDGRVRSWRGRGRSVPVYMKHESFQLLLDCAVVGRGHTLTNVPTKDGCQ